ncbi:MAG TPA: hypothetical protein VMU93_06535 [Caulobacteraceae bacterium]|nr:hypothetical protein [Caulobacteraceae bacterium]
MRRSALFLEDLGHAVVDTLLAFLVVLLVALALLGFVIWLMGLQDAAFSFIGIAHAQVPAVTPQPYGSASYGSLVDAACSNNGQILYWIIGILGTSQAASLLANFRKTIGSRAPLLLKLLDMVAANFFAFAKQQAQQQSATVVKMPPPSAPSPPGAA